MTPFTWFSLSLRVIGAWMAVQSFQFFIFAFNLYKGFDSSKIVSPTASLNQGVGYVAIGVLLIALAPAIASFAYPKEARSQGKSSDADEGTA